MFNPRGYVVVGVSVRSSAQAQFPGQLHDIRAAIRFVRENADEYSIDPDRIVMMGDSSGGWTSAIVGATSDTLQLEGEPDVGGVSSAVQAAVAFFPPVDFPAMDTQTAEQHETYGIDGPALFVHDDPTSPESLVVGCAIQECLGVAAAASPLSYIDGSEPPMAIFHGTHDPLLPPGQSQSLYEGMRDAGVDVSLALVDGSGHLVAPLPPGVPPPPFDLGVPVLDAESFTLASATGGVETLDEGVAPTWDAIAEFLAGVLGTES